LIVTAKKSKSAFPQGSLDMLILKSLESEARHGYGIARHLKESSRDFIQLEEGSLYPALHRMEKRGWIQSEWGQSESNRRAKFYRLSSTGRKQLKQETADWGKMVEAIQRVIFPSVSSEVQS
jgi:transcriptional regulator